MKKEILIPPCTGAALAVPAGALLTVVDAEGGQVADFFAENARNPEEFLSPGVTLDCHESLRLHPGDALYSNLYRPMLEIVSDDVGTHDLLFPACRPEMYDFFYHNGAGHPNCLDNINRALGERRPILQPVNLFMFTEISPSGKITIHPPRSKAGDKIVFRAKMDLRVAIAACSVAEGDCNAQKCSSILAIVEE